MRCIQLIEAHMFALLICDTYSVRRLCISRWHDIHKQLNWADWMDDACG